MSDPSRASRRNDKLLDERDRLFRAAWTVLRRNGHANANITDILAEAELSTRAFYRQFGSKDELIEAMFRHNAESTSRAVARRVDSGGTPLERLEAWIDAVLDLGHDAQHQESARLFTSPPIRAVIASAGDDALALLRAPLHRALCDGRADGSFDPCEPDADVDTIFAIAWQQFERAALGGEPGGLEAAREQVRRFVLPALGVVRHS